MGGFSQKNRFREIKQWQHRKFQELSPDLVTTGMAIGWDQWAAENCIDLNIPFQAALPFEGQENRWPPKTQQHYHWLVSKATRVVYVDREEGYVSREASPGVYHVTKMFTRNQWMVDQLEAGDYLLSLWNGVCKGGTYATIKYFKQVLPVILVDRQRQIHINVKPQDFDDVPF